MNLTPRQREIAKFTLRHKPKLTILEGAVRSGKTFLNNYIFGLWVGLHLKQGLHYIITGHTLGSVRRNVLDPLAEASGKTIRLDQYGTFTFLGNKVHCFGADKADSYKAITGVTAHGWYGNEVTLQHKNTIAEVFTRLSGNDAIATWDTNPDFPEHPIKTDYIDKSGELLSNGKLRIKSWHFEIDDNPYLSDEYVENLKATTPPGMWYDRRIKGLWVAAEGQVYEGWNKEVHVIDPFDIPNSWTKIRGIDFGFTNPFVCLWGAIDEDGRLYIYDEHYKAQELIADHVIAIKDRPGNFRFTVSDHDAQERAELHNNGVYTTAADKEVAIGIQKVAERLMVQGDGRPRLMVFSNCANTIREMGAYRWQESVDGKPQKEEPMKVDDHTADALRYMVMELDMSRRPKVTATRRIW